MRRAVIAVTLGGTAAVIVAIVGSSVAEQLSGGAVEGARSAARLLAAFAGIAYAGGFVLATGGRRRAGLGIIGGATAIVVAWIAFVSVYVPHRAPLVLLESDRSGLAEVDLDGRRWVAHQTLGFRLPQPSVTLAPDEEIVRETVDRAGVGFADEHQLWAFAAEDGSLTVVLDLSRAEEVARPHLERMLDAVAAPLRAEHEVESAIEMRGACGVARFGADIGRGGRVDGRVLAFRDPRSHRAFHLAITIVGPASAQASEFLDEVYVPCD